MTTPAPHRALGRSGPLVWPLALGREVFGGTADAATSLRLLDAWVDSSMELVDTADAHSHWASSHSGGESEASLGKCLKQSVERNKVLIATKTGPIGRYPSHDDDANTPLAPLNERAGTATLKLGAGALTALSTASASPCM